MGMQSFFQVAIIFLVMLVVSCTSVHSDFSRHVTTSELVFGYIQVETDGSNPRRYPTNVRFFFLTNAETGERFRIDVNSDSEVFALRLPAGNYSVDRVQFNEGPFMAESHMQIEFYVNPERATYLGVWQFEIETPRTVRLMRLHILEGDPDFPKKFSTNLVSEHTPIETVLPKPDTFEARVFSVAPIPKVKYFYRQ